MVLTVSFVISPVTGLFCHRRLADTGVSGPLGLTSPSAKLDASVGASGPHDFAVRSGAVRQRHHHVHRIPHPTSVTIAIRPSDRDGICLMYCCFYPSAKQNIFCDGAGQTNNRAME